VVVCEYVSVNQRSKNVAPSSASIQKERAVGSVRRGAGLQPSHHYWGVSGRGTTGKWWREERAKPLCIPRRTHRSAPSRWRVCGRTGKGGGRERERGCPCGGQHPGSSEGWTTLQQVWRERTRVVARLHGGMHRVLVPMPRAKTSDKESEKRGNRPNTHYQPWTLVLHHTTTETREREGARWLTDLFLELCDWADLPAHREWSVKVRCHCVLPINLIASQMGLKRSMERSESGRMVPGHAAPSTNRNPPKVSVKDLAPPTLPVVPKRL
jgi:hypothetical protein